MKDYCCAREPLFVHFFFNKLGKKTRQRNTKSLKLKSKLIFTKNNADKAGAVKGSRNITTQHHQLIFYEIFTKDNAEVN